MKKFFREFKKFITKGNVLDLAVAVIIGAAFNKIVSSLVADILTPLISLATGEASLTELKYILREGTDTVTELSINYGQFIQYIIDFLIIALTIFIIVRLFAKFKDSIDFNLNMTKTVQEKFNKGEELNKVEMKWYNRFKKKYPDKAPKTLEEQASIVVEEPKKPEPTETERLLTEILNELKENKKSK